MERLKLIEIKQWDDDPNREPLVVWGARQVGKTYLIKELFAQEYYKDSYIYVDLKRDIDIAKQLNSSCDPKKYISYLELVFNRTIDSNTLLIFDEVQECPNVFSSLKYFKQDYRQIPVIMTGSMVRLAIRQFSRKKNNNFLYPVGCFSSIDVYPLTFEEYLLNTNKKLLDQIKKDYLNKEKSEKYIHDLAFEKLYEYMLVGGMPEAVKKYIDTGSYIETKKKLGTIYDNYLGDMSEYNVSNETILKTMKIYQNIYKQLSKENKNFKISNIEKGKSNRDYFNAYQWLELSRVIYRNHQKQEKVTSPLIEENEGLFRYYLSDVGLFVYQSNIDASLLINKDKQNTLSGVFFENYVADELVANGINLFYWVGKNDNEFEFIIENGGRIIPIDVKKGRSKMNSVENFRNHNKMDTIIKISSNEYGYDENRQILTIPLYEVFMLAKDIKENKVI